MPEDIGQLHQLETLKIGRNNLEALPNNICSLLELRELTASNNRIGVLPQGLGQLKKLEKLSLRDNLFETLPASCAQLTELRELDLSQNNNLTNLPEFIGNFSGLKNLKVKINPLLTALPNSITTLENLENLDISSCALTTLPESIGNLSSLRSLNLYGNQLTHIPESLLRLPAACEVNLQNNRFSEAVIVQLRATINAPGYTGPRIFFSMATPSDLGQGHTTGYLSQAVAKWYAQVTQESSAFSRAAWKEFEKENSSRDFSVFLRGLHHTVNSSDPAFRLQIVNWLTRLASDLELRKEIFLEAKEGIASCEDRVSLTLNAMKQRELTLNVLRGHYDNQLNQLIPLARQQYRLNELAKIAYAKVQTLRFVDEIDVYLAYQVKLRETLALAIDTKDMRFFGVAGVTEDDLQTAALQVKQNENKHFLRYLANEWEPWQSVLKRLDPQGYQALQDEIYEAKTDRLTEVQNALLAERNLPPTEANFLNVTSEALQTIADGPNQVFTKAFLKMQENKTGGTPGLNALLEPVWEI